jgi:glycosyltransferase involved in cell wall biosynthesis
MKIAQVAPLVESVPPKLYGGTERIVAYLVDELVRQGHEVTLFASGDSVVKAELIPCGQTALRLNPRVKDWLPHYLMMIEQVRTLAGEFDIIHFHIDLLQFPLFQDVFGHSVTTLHGRLDLPDLYPFYETFSEVPLVSISKAQRKPMPGGLNWAGNVYHGLPRDVLPFKARPAGGYLAFLGRISPEKRPDRAIEIAVEAGLPLKMAAKVDVGDKAYWHDVVEPLVRRHSNVEFLGEVNKAGTAALLGDARALLFPIDWPEPFGLVMIEAMACGTPVIAFGSGSVPEVVDHGASGFIVNDIEAAVRAVHAVDALDRHLVRATFERRFSVERMAREYLRIYGALAAPPRVTGRSIDDDDDVSSDVAIMV